MAGINNCSNIKLDEHEWTESKIMVIEAKG